MRNPVNPNEPQLILPFKYLDEVKNAPQNRLSFPLFSKQVCCSWNDGGRADLLKETPGLSFE